MTVIPGPRRSASWLVETTDADAVFTPERLSEEHRLIARTTEEFMAQEVLPSVVCLEQHDWNVARALLRRCGQLGLLGPDVPAAYGGSEFDTAAALVVNQHLSGCASFAAMAGAQSNLTIMPILLFGTEAQKQQYLPGLVAGELVGAYALSEAEAGSDVLNARTRAARQPDGSFVLDGEKMWVTNGGFADLFVVFAKIDGEQFSAFVVERSLPGVSTGREESKMGLHGCSTVPLVLQEVRVPAGNLLGEVGKGRKVAYGVLNGGRFELGATCVGAAAGAIGESARYAAQRRQFGQPIAGFGAIRHKLAEMTIRAYAAQSLVYRVGGLMDAHLADRRRDGPDAGAALAALEEFGIEASIAKVAGSEMLDYVLDENVQIHGGNGFVKDHPAEGHYRDARVNRIFEGTNEINRLVIAGTLLRKTAVRRAAKAERLRLSAPESQDHAPVDPGATTAPATDGPLEHEARAVAGARRIALMILGLAIERFGERIADEQEVLMSAADIAIEVLGADSALLRARAASRSGVPTAALQIDAARVFVHDAAARIEHSARRALPALADGDELRAALAALPCLLVLAPANTVVLCRRIADETVARGTYLFP